MGRADPPTPHWGSPRGTCRWCGKGIIHESGPKKGLPNLRRNWHPDCVEEWKLRTDANHQRRFVRDRDKGVCARCGLDTREVAKMLRHMVRVRHGNVQNYRRRASVKEYARLLGFDKPDQSLWEADHIVELQDKGENYVDNIQTLCQPCHRTKTQECRELRKKLRTRARAVGCSYWALVEGGEMYDIRKAAKATELCGPLWPL